jgi:hypothetical protein
VPQRTNEFQQVVYQIQVQLKDRPNTVVTESKMLVDRNSGKLRETDIAVECRVNDVSFIIAFECRSRSRGSAIDWVEQMIKKHEHLSDKLVLVANKAVSPDALDLARREGADTVVLGVADSTDTDWSARIDQYQQLFLASFEFMVKTFSVEYEPTAGSPFFDTASMIVVTDSNGVSGLLDSVVNSLVNNPDCFLKPISKMWYERPLDQRRNDHTVTMEYVPPRNLPMMLTQGLLSYPLKKLKIEIGAKIAEAPLALGQSEYKGTRVAHGKANLLSGDIEAQSVHFVMTEQQGHEPKATMMVFGSNGAANGPVRTVHLEPADATEAGYSVD